MHTQRAHSVGHAHTMHSGKRNEKRTKPPQRRLGQWRKRPKKHVCVGVSVVAVLLFRVEVLGELLVLDFLGRLPLLVGSLL